MMSPIYKKMTQKLLIIADYTDGQMKNLPSLASEAIIELLKYMPSDCYERATNNVMDRLFQM